MKKLDLKSTELALNGGAPIRRAPWSPGPLHVRAELAAMKRALRGPALPLAGGPCVTAFRDDIASLFGVEASRVVTTSSGTTAIHAALAAAGVGRGDRVLVSPLTDYGSVSGILQLQAVPVFIDVGENSLAIDASKLRAGIGRKTRAIVVVHNGGYPADMEAITAICRNRRVKVIEDCAQSHLARIGDRHVGLFGDFGAFSTNETKHMKTGEGGFVICRNRADAHYADLFADKSYDRSAREARDPSLPAINARMSEINAALGVEQLRRLPGWVERRRRAGARMDRILSRFPLRPHWRPEGARPSYWWCAFSLDRRRVSVKPRQFARALAAEGVPCRCGLQPYLPGWRLFRRLNRNPDCFRAYKPGNLRRGAYPVNLCPQARRMAANMLAVPVNQHTGKSEIRDLERALEKIFELG